MKDGTEVDLAEEDADKVTDLFVLSAACDIIIFVTANNTQLFRLVLKLKIWKKCIFAQ